MNNPNINSDSFDQDLPMFAAMRPAMFTQKLGMQHALAEQFSLQANDAIALAAAAHRSEICAAAIEMSDPI
jgi:hypothetical protein